MTEVVARAVNVTKRFDPNAAPALDAVSMEVMGGVMTGLVRSRWHRARRP